MGLYLHALSIIEPAKNVTDFNTMYQFLRSLLGLFLLALLCQCAASPAKPLYPLEAGLYWIYEAEKNGQTLRIENHIEAAITIGKQPWFLSLEYGERFWIRNALEGQVEAVNLFNKKPQDAVFEKLDPKAIRQELLFKFPAQKGDHWAMLENTLRYEGLQTLTVPAGTFKCHAYSITQHQQTYAHSCVAEGVGVIYNENQLENGDWEVSRLLEWGKRGAAPAIEDLSL